MPDKEPHLDETDDSVSNEYSSLVPTTEKESTVLDLQTPEMTQRFAEAPLFIKSAIVTARDAVPGEKITTTLADGTHETVNVSEEGGKVVTNPSGEEYVLTGENFSKRYEALEDGRYRAKGACRAFVNPTGEDITIIAPWGEEQHGGPDAMVAVAVDLAEPDKIGSDRYIIGGKEFAETYTPAS